MRKEVRKRQSFVTNYLIMNNSAKLYIGVDLGDRKHHYCVTDKDGNILEESSLANTRNALSNLVEKYPQPILAMETGTHSPWISRHLESLGVKVYVANARELPMISKNMRKTDKNDARILAKLVRLDPSILRPIKHVSEESQKGQIVLKLRESATRRRVDLTLTVRGVFKSLGYIFPKGSPKSLPKKVRAFMSEHPEYADILDPTVCLLEQCNETIKTYDKQIDKAVENHTQATAFRAIHGVGPITALAFSLLIQDPKRFKDSRDVAAYLGLVPRQSQSGAIDKELPISKTGNSMVRKLLVQCAQYMLGAFGQECALREWGLKLVARGGQSAKRKAIVAVARKLAVTLVAMWKKQTPFQAFPSTAKG